MSDNTLKIIKDDTLTYHQTVLTLARDAENSIDVLHIPEHIQKMRDSGVICDLFEGHAPYRPRYIVPDYGRLMREGCEFLKLEAPTSLEDALDTLLIFYKHVPSITSFPVYLGNIDTLIDGFVTGSESDYQAIKRFFRHIDRTLTDSFCHANIGPLATKAGELILRAQRELQTSVPNLTVKVDGETPQSFLVDCARTALVTAKPSFANHDVFSGDLGEDYAIVSCYNGLKIGGGSHSLVRIQLHRLALMTDSQEEFFERLLPDAVRATADYLTERIRFLVEETPFFSKNFLVTEGFIRLELFSAMLGMVGLAEAVNHLSGNPKDKEERFGHSEEANALGLRIVDTMRRILEGIEAPYLGGSDGHYLLHAQVGIDTDYGTSPGCRIPIGEEPPVIDHIIASAPFHQYFPTGIGDIFSFDQTYERQPEALVDIMRGAFSHSLRYISFYGADSDVVRITGYLVKRSDMERLDRGEAVLNGAAVLGLGAVKNQKVLDRKLRK